MSAIPTIRVKPWGEGQGDFVEINEADFDASVHEMHGEASKDLTIGKGPGGRIFIKDGKTIHSGPFSSEEEAAAALEAK